MDPDRTLWLLRLGLVACLLGGCLLPALVDRWERRRPDRPA